LNHEHARTNARGARIDGSYPSPDEFSAIETKNGYLFAPEKIGFVIYHELAHFISIEVLPKLISLGVLEQTTFYHEYIENNEQLTGLVHTIAEQLQDATIDSAELVKTEESVADLLAKAYFERAHQHYLETGDDSLYCFAIQVPPTKSTPGGWQITETPNQVA
jgi:hypothetical protein